MKRLHLFRETEDVSGEVDLRRIEVGPFERYRIEIWHRRQMVGVLTEEAPIIVTAGYRAEVVEEEADGEESGARAARAIEGHKKPAARRCARAGRGNPGCP